VLLEKTTPRSNQPDPEQGIRRPSKKRREKSEQRNQVIITHFPA
jgi:hypothetical protein